jgi:pimeloyl-ACP methyl ester carboxylesterase
LYLHGVADGALGAEVLHEVDRHLPAAGSHHLLLPDMGHFLHLEAPDRVWEVIEKWLAD